MEYPKIGIPYYHYKGGIYEVISMATHSETNEPMVVYKSLLFGSVYVRPLSMWFEEIDVKIKIPDFKKMQYKPISGKLPRFSEDPKVYK